LKEDSHCKSFWTLKENSPSVYDELSIGYLPW